ncbi:MAG: NADH-quinone oxidoreductase subunit N [Planctomycetota bacterium]
MLPDLTTLSLLLPEIILILSATALYVGGAFRPRSTGLAVLGSGAYAVALGLLLTVEWTRWESLIEQGATVSGPLSLDYLGQLMRSMTLVIGLLLSLVMSRTAPDELKTEHAGTLMLAIAGLMFVARANELVLLFVGLELISIPTYALLFMGRRDRATGEATAKYFFLSLLSSGLLLYGLSFLYGMAGTTTLIGAGAEPGIREVVANLRAAAATTVAETAATTPNLWLLAPLAVILVSAGLCFKLAAVPFHFYAPDVYQGATAGNAALLAVLPKAAGVLAFTRLVVAIFPAYATAWQMSVIVAILTMTLGNICALWQKHVRRLLGYSSIAHSGYLLIGLSVALVADNDALRAEGLAATLFYLAAYAFASLGGFAALTYMAESGKPVDHVEQLAGCGRTHPLAAGVLAVSMFSFAGIPVFAGFWGKFALFASTLEMATGTNNGPLSGWFATLAIVGALNAAIGAAYYLRIVGAMFFQPAPTASARDASEEPAAGSTTTLSAMVACGLLVIGMGVVPAIGFRGAGFAGQSVAATAIPMSTVPVSTSSMPLAGASPAPVSPARVSAATVSPTSVSATARQRVINVP